MQVSEKMSSGFGLHKVLRLRKRYFFTKNNKLRLRYIASSMVVASFMTTSMLGSMGSSIAYVPAKQDMVDFVDAGFLQEIIDRNDYSEKDFDSAELAVEEDYAEKDQPEYSEEVTENIGSASMLDLKLPEKPLEPREELLKVGPGETLAGVLQDVGVSSSDAYNAVRELSKHIDPRSVKVGQAVSVRLEPGDAGLEFAGLNMKLDPIKEVSVQKADEQTFKSEIKEKKVILHTNAAKASIDTSLYGSAARAGIPASVVAEMIRIYSYQIDFQRDIRRGDTIEILYETYETEDGDFARYGNVLFANLNIGGKDKPLYRFESDSGKSDFFTADGMNIKKALMRTPIDGARMTSGFGMRHHPVLGYNKMHKGVDFGASRGTPIYAAGDGVIEIAGRKGAYGNYVRIKHNDSLKTAYAHMHKFASGIAAGTRVQQGQVIGYVGTTGRSTGPHLHFEVIKNGQQINPGSLNLPMGNRLAGADLKRFKKSIKDLEELYANMTKDMKFAKNMIGKQIAKN